MSVITRYTHALDYKMYSLLKYFLEINGYTTGEFSKLAKRINVTIKSTLIKSLDPILILSPIHYSMTAFDSNIIHEDAVMRLF